MEDKLIASDIAPKEVISKQVFFFRYNDEEPFAIDNEAHASDLYYNQGNWTKRGLRYVGQSDGSIYRERIKEITKKSGELSEKINEYKGDLKKYDKTFERFKFEELLSDDDPKIIKINEITKDIESKLEKATKEQENIKRVVIKKALEEEIIRARENKEPPRNMDFKLHKKMSDPQAVKRVGGLDAFSKFK